MACRYRPSCPSFSTRGRTPGTSPPPLRTSSRSLTISLQPFLPKFHHALLDLTRFNPDTDEDAPRLRVVLQLMKLARRKELPRFFTWLAGFSARELPDNLLGLMLLYPLHSDSDLDAKKIYHPLSTNPKLKKNAMSVAEKVKAEGRVKGLRIGKIQAFEEFLGKAKLRTKFSKPCPSRTSKRFIRHCTANTRSASNAAEQARLVRTNS